jgi:hypothetical protein
MSTSPSLAPPTIADDELYGLLAEFERPGAVVLAAKRARQAGYTRMEAYSPIPVHGLSESLGKAPTRLPYLTLLGGVLGAITGYAMQYYASVIDYPINVGGRPLHSWPAFLPVVFELTVLGAALFSVFGMLALNGLPMPYHPVFNVPEFKLASRNRFFLCLQVRDPKFDRVASREFLQSLSPTAIHEVPR